MSFSAEVSRACTNSQQWDQKEGTGCLCPQEYLHSVEGTSHGSKEMFAERVTPRETAGAEVSCLVNCTTSYLVSSRLPPDHFPHKGLQTSPQKPPCPPAQVELSLWSLEHGCLFVITYHTDWLTRVLPVLIIKSKWRGQERLSSSVYLIQSRKHPTAVYYVKVGLVLGIPDHVDLLGHRAYEGLKCQDADKFQFSLPTLTRLCQGSK